MLDFPASFLLSERPVITDFLKKKQYGINNIICELYQKASYFFSLKDSTEEILYECWYTAKRLYNDDFLNYNNSITWFREKTRESFRAYTICWLAFTILDLQEQLPEHVQSFKDQMYNTLNEMNEIRMNGLLYKVSGIKDIFLDYIDHADKKFHSDLTPHFGRITRDDLIKGTNSYELSKIEESISLYRTQEEQLRFFERVEADFSKDLPFFDDEIAEIKKNLLAGKYLSNQYDELPRLSENADEESKQAVEKYEQRVKDMELRIQTLEAKKERIDAQDKLNSKLQVENDSLEAELNVIRLQKEQAESKFNISLEEIASLKHNVEQLQEEIIKAKAIADDSAKGKFEAERKKYKDKIKELEDKLGDVDAGRMVPWDLLFETALEIPEIGVVQSFLLKTITASKSDYNITGPLYDKLSGLDSEQKRRKDVEKTKSRQEVVTAINANSQNIADAIKERPEVSIAQLNMGDGKQVLTDENNLLPEQTNTTA